MSLYTSVLASIEALGEVDPRDEACVELALSYARVLENGDSKGDRGGTSIAELGPKLLACMVQLRMTPQSRSAAMLGGAGQPAKVDPLDEIRQRRARHLGA